MIFLLTARYFLKLFICINFLTWGRHLYGLEAINANNEWAISTVGITIVFSGLVMLSQVIAQLRSALALWEDPLKSKAFFKIEKHLINNIVCI